MAWDPTLVEAIFSEALGKGTPEERAAFLERACGGDLELKSRVEALLRADARAGGFLEKPAMEGAAAGPQALSEEGGSGATKNVPELQPTETAGSRIGPYKLLQLIGEGGMGSVSMAEQEEPVRRMVALKVIKAGMDSKQVLARFDAERQALALMDHPNIAKVFDAGTTARGRPYFVMELVKGIPITLFWLSCHLGGRSGAVAAPARKQRKRFALRFPAGLRPDRGTSSCAPGPGSPNPSLPTAATALGVRP